MSEAIVNANNPAMGAPPMTETLSEAARLEIGKRLAEARFASSKGFAAIAASAGLRNSELLAIEHGHRVPTYQQIEKILSEVNLTVQSFAADLSPSAALVLVSLPHDGNGAAAPAHAATTTAPPLTIRRVESAAAEEIEILDLAATPAGGNAHGREAGETARRVPPPTTAAGANPPSNTSAQPQTKLVPPVTEPQTAARVSPQAGVKISRPVSATPPPAPPAQQQAQQTPQQTPQQTRGATNASQGRSDADAAPAQGRKRRFFKDPNLITIERMEEVLGAFFTRIKKEYAEYVFSWKCEETRITVTVFTSIDVRTGIARARGEDAIRIVVWDARSRRVIEPWSKTLNRIGRWQTRLREKVGAAVLLATTRPVCFKCGSQLEVRGENDKQFWGCPKYPVCRGGRSFEPEETKFEGASAEARSTSEASQGGGAPREAAKGTTSAAAATTTTSAAPGAPTEKRKKKRKRKKRSGSGLTG